MRAILDDPRGRGQEEHVGKARGIVARQRRLIDQLRTNGRDCAEAEDLLALLEASLAVVEGDPALTPLKVPSRTAPSPR